MCRAQTTTAKLKVDLCLQPLGYKCLIEELVGYDTSGGVSLSPPFGVYDPEENGVYTPDDCVYFCSIIPECYVATYLGNVSSTVRRLLACCRQVQLD